MGNLLNNVNGVSDDTAIANEFMKHFGSVYNDSNLDVISKAVYLNEFDDDQLVTSPETNIELVNVEMVDKCLRGLKLGKASGPDGLHPESVLNVHPKLVTLICALFRSILLHNYVPIEFGQGINVPLIKDMIEDHSYLSNYRVL